MSAPIPLSEPCQIGRFYTVPAVRMLCHELIYSSGVKFKRGERIPIIGPEHEDAEIVGFPHQHWHIDWRFVNGRIWDRVLRVTAFVAENNPAWGNGRVFGIPLMRRWNNRVQTGDPEPMRMKCQRAMPVYPSDVAFLPALEKAYADHRLGKCRVCPHQRVPLGNLPVEADGSLTCPAHGLRWNATTGALMPRKQAPM